MGCKCGSNKFKAQFDTTIHAVVDSNLNILEELKIYKDFSKKSYSTVYKCIECENEYSSLKPLMRHQK